MGATHPSALERALSQLLGALLALWPPTDTDKGLNGSGRSEDEIPPGLAEAFDCARRVEAEARAALALDRAEGQSAGDGEEAAGPDGSPDALSLHTALQASALAITCQEPEHRTVLLDITDKLKPELLVHSQAQLVGLLVHKGFQARSVFLAAGMPVGASLWASLGLSFSDLAAGITALCGTVGSGMDTAVAAAVATVHALLSGHSHCVCPDASVDLMPMPGLPDLEDPTHQMISWIRADSARCFTAGHMLQAGAIAGHLLNAYKGQESELFEKLTRFRGHCGALQTACLAILWASWDVLGCECCDSTDCSPSLGHSEAALLACLEASLRGREPLGNPADLAPSLAAEMSWRSFGFCYAYVDAICRERKLQGAAKSAMGETSGFPGGLWVWRVCHLAGRGKTLRRYALTALRPFLVGATAV